MPAQSLALLSPARRGELSVNESVSETLGWFLAQESSWDMQPQTLGQLPSVRSQAKAPRTQTERAGSFHLPTSCPSACVCSARKHLLLILYPEVPGHGWTPAVNADPVWLEGQNQPTVWELNAVQCRTERPLCHKWEKKCGCPEIMCTSVFSQRKVIFVFFRSVFIKW